MSIEDVLLKQWEPHAAPLLKEKIRAWAKAEGLREKLKEGTYTFGVFEQNGEIYVSLSCKIRFTFKKGPDSITVQSKMNIDFNPETKEPEPCRPKNILLTL